MTGMFYMHSSTLSIRHTYQTLIGLSMEWVTHNLFFLSSALFEDCPRSAKDWAAGACSLLYFFYSVYLYLLYRFVKTADSESSRYDSSLVWKWCGWRVELIWRSPAYNKIRSIVCHLKNIRRGKRLSPNQQLRLWKVAWFSEVITILTVAKSQMGVLSTKI